MKSTEVYKVAGRILASWCKEHKFKRTKTGVLGYYKPHNDNFLAFWFQCSQFGWEAYAGSSFIVEFQISDSPQLYTGDIRHRLPYFLSKKELQLLKEMQNRVIAKLPEPDANDVIFQLYEGEEIEELYLDKFQPVKETYTNRTDIWLRYHDEEDVRMWVEFILTVLPRIINELEEQN